MPTFRKSNVKGKKYAVTYNGKTINFGSEAKDANDNVTTIVPLDNTVKVAEVFLDVPTLLRNEDNDSSATISVSDIASDDFLNEFLRENGFI